MSVFETILKRIKKGMVLYTPVQRKQFSVYSVDDEKLVFFVGAKTKIEVPRACWDGIPSFLKGRGWVKIGAKHETTETFYLGLSKDTWTDAQTRLALPRLNT